MTYDLTQSKKLANYLQYRGFRASEVDFDALYVFVNNGANPLVNRNDFKNLFEIASYNRWSNQSWLKLIEICKAGKVPPDEFTDGLADYLKYQGLGAPKFDFDVLKAFVSNGAYPLVHRYGNWINLFGIASYNRWSNQSWLKLIEICKVSKVTPDEFTAGLADYLKYQGPGAPKVDFEVIKAFVSNGANPLVEREHDEINLFGIAVYNQWSNQSWLKLIEICKVSKVTPDEFTAGLANYLKYQGPGAPKVDFEVIKAFVSNGANPLVLQYGDWISLFEIAAYNRWSNQSWLKLIEIFKVSKVTPDEFTEGLANYLKYQGPMAPRLDFEVIKAFVNNGADPLVFRRGDWKNLFEIASYNQWSKQSWLKLIEICEEAHVMPIRFTLGLADYLGDQGLGDPKVDFDVLKAFIKNGATPLVRRRGDNKSLLEIGSDNQWSNDRMLELHRIVSLYKVLPSISPAQFMQEFQQELDTLSVVIEQFKEKIHHRFTFEQDYQSASIAGKELLDNLAKYQSDYEDNKITLDQFRRSCLCSIKCALQTDLAKQHIIYRALVSFLNFITGLTLIIPIASKITTGRWGLFTNSATESEKHLRQIADNLKRCTDDENHLPAPTT